MSNEKTCATCNFKALPERSIPCSTCTTSHKNWTPMGGVEPRISDVVNHPSHYTAGKIEVIDIIESVLESMDLTPNEAFLTGQVLKYMGRWKNKGGREDLKKAHWYLCRLIEDKG